MADRGLLSWLGETSHPHDPVALANGIGQAIGQVQQSLLHVERTVLALLGRYSPAASAVRSTDLVVLQPLIEAVLDNHRGLISGAGYVAEPGVLSDCTYWLEWLMESKGAFSRLEVSFEEGSLAKYDYLDAAWFKQPRSGASSTLIGPYVDVGGVNKYLVTFAMPVRDGDLFLGIVGADIIVDQIEGMLRRLSRDMKLTTTIVNQDGRIIATSSPQLQPGVLVQGLDSPACADAGEVTSYQCGSLPWTLLVTSPAFPARQLLRGAPAR
jgi:hypothetical protein